MAVGTFTAWATQRVYMMYQRERGGKKFIMPSLKFRRLCKKNKKNYK